MSQSPAPIPATITIDIQQFRSLGGVFPITCGFSLTQGDPNIFVLDGKNIYIRVPLGQAVQLTFALPDPGYVLLGIAYESSTGSSSTGRTQFPTITLNRSPRGCTMVVTDSGASQASYDYVILVQNALTGEIGIIDPVIENQPD